MNKKIMFALLALNAGAIYASAPQEDGKAKTEKEGAEKKPVLVTLPSAKILEERMKWGGAAHFAKITQFHSKYGGKKKCASEIVSDINLAYSNYDAYLTKNPTENPPMMEIRAISKTDILFKRILIKDILKDFPEAMNESLELIKIK